MQIDTLEVSNSYPVPDRYTLDPALDNYGVMGHPISHSKSPFIHRAFAKQTGQALAYQAIAVWPGEFTRAVQGFRAAGGRGLNVTVPFKQEAWALATFRSKRAGLAAAVNTLSFDDGGGISADNTDGVGLVRDLRDNHRRPIEGQTILIMGAGGAVCGVLEPLLAERPAHVVIANRTVSRAEQLACQFSAMGSLDACGYPALTDRCFDLIINATSASLEGKLAPLPEGIIAPGGWCYDMMYADEPTPFLSWARRRGVEYAVDGIGMLVEQAAESFYIWRGVRPQTEPVIKQLERLRSSRDLLR